MTSTWTPHDTRDNVVDFVRAWSDKTEIPVSRFLPWVGIGSSKFHDWKQRFGQVNEHNAWVPRDHWLTEDEKERIRAFARSHPLEGYRRLTFMMLDADQVACSPASVYRVLKQAGLLAGSTPATSKKGTGFVQPLQAHEHWHVDVSYLNIAGTFYFLCSLLDGYSRFIVHWEIREKMEESDVETILQRAREAFPDARPRIISDNGPQFLAKDFKEFIRIAGMTHVKTSPYYPQSNGKIERWHKTLKSESIRVSVPLSLEDVRRIVSDYVDYYNAVRLHSAIGYITPKDKLEGRDVTIFAARDQKLVAAEPRRRVRAQHGGRGAGDAVPVGQRPPAGARAGVQGPTPKTPRGTGEERARADRLGTGCRRVPGGVVGGGAREAGAGRREHGAGGDTGPVPRRLQSVRPTPTAGPGARRATSDREPGAGTGETRSGRTWTRRWRSWIGWPLWRRNQRTWRLWGYCSPG